MSDNQNQPLPFILTFAEPLPDDAPADQTRYTKVERETTDDD